MAFDAANRLIRLGMATQLASEIARQIGTGAGDPLRLISLGVPYPLADEIAKQINAGAGQAQRLMALGVAYPLAIEMAEQILPAGPRLSVALSGPMTPGSTVTLTATITGAETPVTSLASVSLTVGGSAVTLSGTGLVRTGTIPAGAMAGASIVADATAVADGNTISGGATSTVVAIHVAPPIAAGAIPDQAWTVGVAVSLDVSSDFTGTGITYALAPSSSALPAGLSLSSAGLITGTPTAAATGTIVVRGTNGGGYADTGFGFEVVAEATALIGIDGWTVQAPNPAALVGTTLTLTRGGFTSSGAPTTKSETLGVTAQLRQPYPNHTVMTPDTAVLSDYVYSSDSVMGVTNNSTETSPKPIANWVEVDRLVVGNTIPARALEIVAFHRDARAGEQIACAEWVISDGASEVVVRASASVVSGRSGDKNAVIVYRPTADVDVSSLANPATLTVNANVYPHIGDASSVLRSADQAVGREFGPRGFRRDTALAAAPPLAYVSTTGNDTTGAVSSDAAVASATPCATIAGAINRIVAVNGRLDGCEIRLLAGTHAVTSTATTRPMDYAALTIAPAPGVTVGDAIMSYGAAAARLRMGTAGAWLHIRNLDILRTGTSVPSGEAGSPTEWRFLDCRYNNDSIQSNMMGANLSHRFIGVEFSKLAGNVLLAASSEYRLFRGCEIANVGTEGWLVIGCKYTDPLSAFTRGTRTASGSIIAYNTMTRLSSSTGGYDVASGEDVTGAVLAQNILEYSSAAIAPAVRVSADNATGRTDHILLLHNTVTGFFANGRGNLFYDDGATPRAHRRMASKGNIHCQINHKGDVFDQDGTRLGGRAYLYGIGSDGEFSQYIDAQGGGIGGKFAQAYPGVNANIGTSNSVRNDPLFVRYAGTTAGPTAGAGGGDYHLQAGSPAKGMVKPVLRFDLAGNARSPTLASAGAYE